MDDSDLDIRVIEGNDLPDSEREEIIKLCSAAFGSDYRPYIDSFPDPVHVIGYLDDRIVSHALWIKRWLQVEDSPPMQSAYVEAVVTDEAYRHRGYASAIMTRLAQEITEYELGGLCTGFPEFYSRLGWEVWEGPLFIRTQEGMTSTPGEPVMILRLPNSPELDINAPLSVEWREGELW